MKKNIAYFAILVAVGVHYNKPEPNYFEEKKSNDSRILRDTPWTPRGANQDINPMQKTKLEATHQEEDADQ
jgi:hypothetical protein